MQPIIGSSVYFVSLNKRIFYHITIFSYTPPSAYFNVHCGLICVAQISYLEVEVETLTEQLHTPEVCEEDQNGTMTVDDLDHIQKINRELEQQLSDKNRVSCLYTFILLVL